VRGNSVWTILAATDMIGPAFMRFLRYSIINCLLMIRFMVCLLLFGNADLSYAASAFIAGVVTDEHDGPIEDAIVDAIVSNGTVAAESTTQQDGRFRLELAPGLYVLRAVVKGTTLADAKAEADNKNDQVVLKAGTFLGGSQPAAIKAGPDAIAHEGQIVRIFYATDRERSPLVTPVGVEYSGARNADNELSYGLCLVSIPRDHRIGSLESPSFWSFDFRPSAGKYVTLTRVTRVDEPEFFKVVSSKVQSSDSHRVLIFVHGFNTSFADGARRTAQLAYDLGFDGAPILYSWPSQGSVDSYPADEESIQWTAVHLQGFLENIARNTGASAIQLVAHSMGNRALVNALGRLQMGAASSSQFKEVILAAPDIDTGVFSQLTGALRSHAERITIYASSRDAALMVSHKFHSFPRVGESGANLMLFPGIDTVDATDVDTGLLGHSYFGDERSVLHDLFDLIRYDLGPEHRFGLVKREAAGNSYWAFRP
jgi:esterase/lipase superfamily enzyme